MSRLAAGENTLNRRPRTFWRAPTFWLFALTFAVRLMSLVQHADSDQLVPRGDDMHFYNEWALRITKGQFTDGKAFYGLPGYAWILAGIYTVAGFNPFVVGFVQALLDATTSVFIFALARATFSFARDDSVKVATFVGIVAAIGWTFFLPAQSFSLIVMPTAWLVCAFWGLLLWMLRMEHPAGFRPWLVMGLLVGLCAVVIATILFLVPLLLAGIIWRLRGNGRAGPAWRRPALAACCLLTGLVAGTAPAWAHNFFIAREPVFLSAHSGLNFWIGNNPVANGYPKIPPGLRASQQGLLTDSITLAEHEAGHPLSRADVSKFWSAKASTWIAENRGAWLRLLGTKVRNFWNSYQYDDLSIIKILRADGVLPPGLRFGTVASLALPGLVIAVRRFPQTRWIAAAVGLHMCALLSVFITERYRLCAVPGLLLFSAFFLYQIWEWLTQRRWVKSVGAMTGGIASAWIVSMSSTDAGTWSLDFYNLGIRAYEGALDARSRRNLAREARELDRSLTNLEQAYAYVPDNAEINFALGNTLLAKGERTRARQFYLRALDLQPTHADAWSNVGVMALEDEQWPVAVRCFELSVAADSSDAKTFYLLARAFRGAGQLAKARDALAKAIGLRPQQSEFVALATELDRAAVEPPP